MFQVIDEPPHFQDLRDYVERGGLAEPVKRVRKPGWLIRDLKMLLTEYDRLVAVQNPRPKPKMTWRHAWGMFDRRRK